MNVLNVASDNASSSSATSSSLNVVRLLGMRRFPGLDQVEIDDLAKLLAATTERVVRKNTTLAKRGAPLGSAYFIIEGALRIREGRGGSTAERILGANTIAGIVEMISENEEGLDIECVSDAVVLELERADFLAFCADNFEMLAELLRTFSERVLRLSPFEGTNALHSSARSARGLPHLDPAKYVDRLRLLSRIEALKPFGTETISDLAVALKEERVSPPTQERCLMRAGHAIDSLYVVLSGGLQLGSVRVEPGNVFGLLHAVSESPLAFDLVARPNTRVLTCRREILSDLLEDNLAFTLAWLRELAERILELDAARGR